MSFLVTRRTREIGIRIALGGQRRSILVAVFSRAFAQFGLGAVVGGLIGAFSMADQLAREGPGLLLAVTALTLVVGLFACAVPVARALRIEPTEALREG